MIVLTKEIIEERKYKINSIINSINILTSRLNKYIEVSNNKLNNDILSSLERDYLESYIKSAVNTIPVFNKSIQELEELLLKVNYIDLDDYNFIDTYLRPHRKIISGVKTMFGITDD